MKIPIYDTTKKEIGKKDLPIQFHEEFRPDIIKRVVIAIQDHMRQPYGAHPMAGKYASAVVSRRRRDYRGSYGLGISRVPRKVLNSRGTRMSWVGAFAPGMVGGRRAHPPKVEKKYDTKVNKKERRKAIRSAISATVNKEIVTARGHLLPEHFPFILDSSFEQISKAKDLFSALNMLGLENEYVRNQEKNVRAGRGKSRGRKYKRNRGILIVVSNDCNLYQNGSNLPGVEICKVNMLNVEALAPGTNPGRLTLYTEAAIDRLTNEKLFTDDHVQNNIDVKTDNKSKTVKSVKKETEKKVASVTKVKKQNDNLEVKKKAVNKPSKKQSKTN